jgi:hypothetical protein
MAIKIIEQPDIHLTQSELARYRDDYRRDYSMYAGTPAFEDYVRQRLAKEAHV